MQLLALFTLFAGFAGLVKQFTGGESRQTKPVVLM